jgi:hypothetical protein
LTAGGRTSSVDISQSLRGLSNFCAISTLDQQASAAAGPDLTSHE